MPEPELDLQEVNVILKQVLRRESACIARLANELPESCAAAVQILYSCRGRVIVSGMGKMSAIARKTAAMLCSVGTPAIFLHPAEALHGDLGIVTGNDVLLVLSNSGETRELLELIPYLKRHQVPVISVTGSDSNTLAEVSDLNLATGIQEEADQVTAAPSNSTTTTLALCDGLALALVHCKGFTTEQFAANHPGGQIGRRLLLRVKDLMVVGEALPVISRETRLREAIVVISRGKLGAGLIVNQSGMLQGIITDGDLRRILEHQPNPLDQAVGKLMTSNPRTLSGELLAVEALAKMNEHAITVMPVVEQEIVVGALHLHDLLRAGLG